MYICMYLDLGCDLMEFVPESEKHVCAYMYIYIYTDVYIYIYPRLQPQSLLKGRIDPPRFPYVGDSRLKAFFWGFFGGFRGCGFRGLG